MLQKNPDTDMADASLKVSFRPSQRKIIYPQGRAPDPAHLVIDILRAGRMKTPSRVSPETIINLAENGVPHHVFVDLMRASIGEFVQGLITWDGPHAMYNLWLNVERAGGVLSARRAREAAGEARVRGLEYRRDETDSDDEDDEDGLQGFDRAIDQHSSAWWADQTSGCPSSLEETVMVLLDSGFTPTDCPILREKLKQVLTARIRHRTSDFRYGLTHSASAIAVPGKFIL